MLINFCRSWQVLGKSKSPGSRVPQVAPRAKRPYLQAQNALGLVAVGEPFLRKNWLKPHLSEEIDQHFIGGFCDFPSKICEFYLEMLQSFPPWKSAMNSLLAHVRQLSNLHFDLLQFDRELLSPRLQFAEIDDLGLIGIEQSLVLTFDPLAALE